MTPSKLLNDNVSVKKNFTNVDGMVSSNFVVRHSLIFTGVLVLVKALIEGVS